MKPLPVNMVLSSWKHLPRQLPMWKKPSSTLLGKYMRKFRKAYLTSTTRPTASKSARSTYLPMPIRLPVVPMLVKAVAAARLANPFPFIAYHWH